MKLGKIGTKDLASNLTLDDQHVYRWQGRVVPGVTEVLRPLMKLWTNGNDLDRARAEGKAYHKMIELDCKGDLDEETLPEWLRPFLAAWRKFTVDTGFEATYSEYMAYNETFGYAGKLDLTGMLNKVKGQPWTVIDIKRTLGSRLTGLQLAAYENLLPSKKKYRRFGLQLKPLRFVEYDDPHDWPDFLTALSWHNLTQKLRNR